MIEEGEKKLKSSLYDVKRLIGLPNVERLGLQAGVQNQVML